MHNLRVPISTRALSMLPNIDGSGANIGGMNRRASRLARGSRGEHCIPDGRRSLVFDAQGTKRELVLADAAEQFDAGDRRGRAIMVLEAEHDQASEKHYHGFRNPIFPGHLSPQRNVTTVSCGHIFRRKFYRTQA